MEGARGSSPVGSQVGLFLLQAPTTPTQSPPQPPQALTSVTSASAWSRPVYPLYTLINPTIHFVHSTGTSLVTNFYCLNPTLFSTCPYQNCKCCEYLIIIKCLFYYCSIYHCNEWFASFPTMASLLSLHHFFHACTGWSQDVWSHSLLSLTVHSTTSYNAYGTQFILYMDIQNKVLYSLCSKDHYFMHPYFQYNLILIWCCKHTFNYLSMLHFYYIIYSYSHDLFLHSYPHHYLPPFLLTIHLISFKTFLSVNQFYWWQYFINYQRLNIQAGN